MRPYWVEFRNAPLSALRLGMGVTAYSEADARDLVGQAVPGQTISDIRPVERVADLEQGHVVPNIGNILVRGIWFPLGYGAGDDRP